MHYDRLIPPGGLGNISLAVRIKQGRFLKRVLVQTNDPKHPRFILELKGEILPIIALNRRRLGFYGSVNKKITQILEIYSTDKKPFQILKVEMHPPQLKQINWNVKSLGENKYQIIFTLQNNVPMRRTGKVVIFTDHPKKSFLEVFVYVNIKEL